MKKTIIITGGTGLIGQTIVINFLKKGHKVITSSRNPDRAKYISDNKLDEFQKNLFIVKLDYLKNDSMQNFVDVVESNNLFPEVIIHNARSLDTLKIEEGGITSEKNFLNEYKIGIVGPYNLNNLLMNSTSGKKLKNIILISSIYGIVGPNPSIYKNFEMESPIQYGITKAAQIHLVKELAIRLSSKKVKVNSISFGGILGRADNSFIERYSKFTPQNKMLNVYDVIKPIEFLIDEGTESINGHNLIVDGGWTIW